MAWNDTNPDELDQMEEDATQKAAAARKYAALMDARASGSNAVTAPDAEHPANIPNDQAEPTQPGSSRIAAMFKAPDVATNDSGQTNIPDDQATARQPGSSRIADMFKGAQAPSPGVNESSSPASTTSMVSRPDFTTRNKLMELYNTEAQKNPSPLLFMRQMRAQKLAGLQAAIQMEEQKASGDLGTQQKYQTFFDPKRLANPIQGRSPDGTLKYFQDVFSRDPATGTGKMDYQDTGIEPPMDIRKQVMARGGGAGGMVVTPDGAGGYTSESYTNDREQRPLPGGGTKSVPGGYVDAQGRFHGTVPQTAMGKGRPAYPAAVINGYNALVQTQGKEAANEYLNEWEGRLGTQQPGGQPTVSAPSPGLRPAAPAGARGQVTPQGPAATPPGPGGLKATSHNPQTGQFAAQGPDGKWVTWGGAPAAQRGMGR